MKCPNRLDVFIAKRIMGKEIFYQDPAPLERHYWGSDKVPCTSDLGPGREGWHANVVENYSTDLNLWAEVILAIASLKPLRRYLSGGYRT